MAFRVLLGVVAKAGLAILFILLSCNVPGILCENSTEAAPKVGFVDEPDGRGTMSLIWSCLFTCFICLWSVVHPNIPAIYESEFIWYKRKTGLLLLGAVAPELVVTMSFTQWRWARAFVNDMTQLQTRWNMPTRQIVSEQDELKDLSTSMMQMRELPLNHWTIIHGFFCVMGGFVITTPEGKTFAVNCKQLVFLIENSYVDVPMISARAIIDKSKADPLIKVIAALQAGWFAAQCLGRAIQRLSTSTLEITTVAYVLCMAPVFFFWWYKPIDVRVPTELHVRRWTDDSTAQIRQLDGLTREFFWSNRNTTEFPRAVNTVEIDESRGDNHRYFQSLPNWYPLVATGILYGAVHCVAWDFAFASEAEKWAWRVSALSTILVACMTAVKFSLWHILRYSNAKKGRVIRIEQAFCTLYVLSRVYVFVEVFLGLRSSTAATYDSVDWSLYIPRV